MSASRFELEPQGPFSMEPVRTMACGFLRGTRACEVGGEAVTLAFPADGTFAPAGVKLSWDGRRVLGEVFGGAPAAVMARQVARVLAVDHDARPFERLLAADPVLRRIAAKRAGFRPVVAYSPYSMAGWQVLCHRIRMSQAAVLANRIAEASGDVVEIDGMPRPSFPRPERFFERSGFPGVPEEKWRRLQAVAASALDGELEAEGLAAMPYAEARERLMQIHGVGPWTADAVLVRGVGLVDALPLGERALHGAVALAYGLRAVPSAAELERIAESWRPFRTWVSVLLVSEHFDAARALVPSTRRAPSIQRRSAA
jgi:DNA-3-methyladenine glycosylase II